MKYYTYKITNIINDKVYIGKTHQPQERFRQHLRDAQLGSDRVLSRALRKYGEDSFTFEIISEYDSEQQQSLAESELIRQYDCCILDGIDKGYNMTRGGDGFSSEESSYYLNKRTAEGRNPFSKGNSYYQQARDFQKDLVDTGKHVFQQEEHRKKVSEAQLRMIAEGNHLFSGDDYGERSSALQKKLLAEGKHHFLNPEFKEKQKEITQKQINEGTHNFTKDLTCPNCGKSGKGPMMKKWHFDNCGRKFVYYNDGTKSFRIPEDETPDSSWKKGMAQKK